MSAESGRPVLRRARTDDIPELIEVAGRSFYDAYIPYDDPGEIENYVREHFTPAYFQGLIDEPGRWCDVLTLDDEIVGYLVLKDGPPPDIVATDRPLELARIYLRADDVGKGYGQVLMRRAFELAHDEGFSSLWLLVYRKNTSAQAFYSRYGFEEVGVIDFLFGGRIYKDPIMVATVPPTE